jgi:hypothetical protein
MTLGGTVTVLDSFNNTYEFPLVGLIQATDGNFYGLANGQVVKITTGFTIPSITYSSGLNFFSVPEDVSSLTPAAVLGYTNPVLALWDQNAATYYVTPESQVGFISPGVGYWARFPQSVSIPTNIGTQVSTCGSFKVTLPTGWTQVGDPYNETIPISSLMFSDGTQTFAQATTNFLVGSIVYDYNTSTGQYEQSTSLVPGKGYWFFAFQPTDVEIAPLINIVN